MIAALSFIVSPIGRYIGGALIILAIAGVIFGKGMVAEKKIITTVSHQEIQHDISSSNDARDAAVKRFDPKRMRDDGFARD